MKERASGSGLLGAGQNEIDGMMLKSFDLGSRVAVALAIALCLCQVADVSFGAIAASSKEAEVVHDLIREYRSAEIRDSRGTSVGDVRGNARIRSSLLKRYLFLHPPGGEASAATAAYSLGLPALGDDEKLFFLFAVGLMPGWREADKEGADGVIFRVLLDEERAFEQLWDKDGWCFCVLDVSGHAGKTLRLTLVCDRNRNNSADWAMWGDPRVVLLREASGPPRISGQADFFIFDTSSGGNIVAEWPALGPEGAGVVRALPHGRDSGLAWFPAPPSAGGAPHLPQMKLADGSSPALSQVSVVSYAPRVELLSVVQSPAIVTPYDRCRVVATVKNTGEGSLREDRAVEVRLAVAAGFRLADGQAATETIAELQPSEEKVVFWRLLAPSHPGKFQFALRIGATVHKVFNVDVYPAGRGIDDAKRGEEPSGFHESEDSIVLEKGSRRLAFVRDGNRFLYGTALLKTAERWTLLGRLAPFAELSIKLRSGRSQRIEIRPARYTRLSELAGKALTDDELAIGFSDEFSDDESVKWLFQQSFVIRKDSPWIDVETSLTPDASREVTLLLAPKFLAGDGTFGESKDQAIFAGLEYPGENEPSSSTRDIAFPQSRRFTPHPLRVTIPFMAVRKGETLIGLSWDVHHRWHEDRDMPGPLFSSPNRFPVQDNHLMALVVPTVPEFIDEGTLDSRRPLSLAASQTLSTKASILLMSDAADITEALVAWIKRHGLPEVRQPRSLEDEIELCRNGFLHSVWSESSQGWSHCIGWPPGPYPGYCTLLNMDYFLSRDEQVRRVLRGRVDLVVGNCLRRFGKGSLWRGDACHILTGELPFIQGRVVQSVAEWERAADSILAAQSADGSWRWRPDARRAVLGKPGDTTSGMCARGACKLLREAIVTGNRKHIAAALKGLHFLDRYSIPTGAQEWECPIYAPDVLAAAYAVRAFVLAHEITGDDAYLQKAIFWARTGIPFIYLWDRGEEIPQMRYAGIPIFGATFHRHSWLGRPVQWCSLVYAYSILRLSRYDDSLDWRRLAEGITTSGMWQQYAEGKSKGCYPDSWDLLENHPNPADINPENILVNLLALNGHDPGLKHRVLNRGDNPIFITSMAEILSAELKGSGAIGIRLKFFPGAKSYLLIAGLPSSCKPNVFFNGTSLEATEDVDGVPAGWVFLPQRSWLVAAITHSERGDALQIRWSPP